MKLFNGLSPNGARVAIFLAEKEIELPTQMVDVIKGDNADGGVSQSELTWSGPGSGTR